MDSNPLAKKLGIFVDLQPGDLAVIARWSADRSEFQLVFPSPRVGAA